MRPRPSPKFPRLTRLPLALEIALALLLKIAILTLLWKAFFSHPQTKKMALPTPQVEQHLLAEPTPNPIQSSSSSSSLPIKDPK